MRKLNIYFTSDTHGYFSALDYASGSPASTGVINCMANFHDDGNTLILDGGDTIQGSPLTYWLHKNQPVGENIPAAVMNLGGYHYVTLGNHDFNYGQENLTAYLSQLNAVCLCANVEGLPHVQKTAVHTLKNGLRVGITGITTGFIPVWEKPENLRGITVSDPAAAAKAALESLKAQGVDLTLCIYHGGFEADLATGRLLSDTRENQAWQICQELDFDVLLTGHQHIPMGSGLVNGTYICQTPDKAKQYIAMTVTEDGGKITAESRLCAPGSVSHPAAAALLAPWEEKVAAWLDTPTGHLDTPLQPGPWIDMAARGSLIANFFNQVQLEASGADISAASLGNEVKGFDRDVTIRDVVATYIYPNTLVTIQVDRAVLKQTLERSAEYFSRDEEGRLCVSSHYLQPKVEHYNYDFISGLEVTVDPDAPWGQRVLSIRHQGQELPEGRKLTLCMNNYRVTGTGGYDAYKTCPVVKDQPTEIVELIMDYIQNHENIAVDKTRWLTLTRY